MSTNDYTDKIDGYLDGTLSTEERTTFEQALSTDANLRKELKTYQLEREAIHAMLEQRYLNKVKTWRAESAKKKEEATTHETKVVAMPARRRTFRRIVSLAASVLLLVFAGSMWYVNNTFSNQNLYESNYVLADAAGDKSGGTTTDNIAEQQFLQTGIQAFFNQKYTTAITALEQIPDSSSQLVIAQYYRGHSHSGLHNYPTAIQNFETVLEQASLPAFINRDKLTYNLLLVKVAAKQIDASFEQQLKELSQNGQAPYHQKAKELEAQLGSFWRNLTW